jgi:hypothetical protein
MMGCLAENLSARRKHEPRIIDFVSRLVVLVLLLSGTSVRAQPPGPLAVRTPLDAGFAYQEQLKNANGPVNGTCDLQFSLWDAAGSGSPPTGGAQIGATQTLPAVTVTNGLFTVVLNAGSECGGTAFTGEARWLQVAVRCPGGSGSYTTLSPARRRHRHPMPSGCMCRSSRSE